MAANLSVGNASSRRGGLPQSAAMMNLLTDTAFNLLIFFVVLADPSTETGRGQQMPASQEENAPAATPETIRLNLRDPAKTNGRLFLNGEPIGMDELADKLQTLLRDKAKPEERIVVVDNTEDTPYEWYITAAAKVESVGGVVVLQLEEEKEVTLP